MVTGTEGMERDAQSVDKKLEGLSIKQRDVISIVFIGHVDAGKSTIGGQVLNKLGMIDQRTLEKYKAQAREKNRESWYLSWALDTDEGERDRGKTAEVGRAYFWLGNKKVVLLDAPGHAMYVSDMISGASQADVAVLVVSARKSEFEAGFEKEGQTKEHVYLSRAGGIRKMVVLVNKMDEMAWSEERFQHIRKKLCVFLQRIYDPQEVFYVPVSGTDGENILEKSGRCPWYGGEPFLGVLKKTVVAREAEKPFSFLIVGRIKNMGVVTYEGKVVTGRLRCAGAVVMPRLVPVAVAAIYDEEDVEICEAAPGDFVRIRLGENYDQAEEGDVVMEPGCESFVASDEFTCTLRVLDTHNIVGVGYQCVLHLGINKKECKVLGIGAMVDKKVVRKRFARKGEKVLARIRVEAPIALNVAAMDMFALRSENMTVGLGLVRRIIRR